MSKKNAGFLVAVGAAIGAAAACMTYYLRYKSFNNELDQDFHDYEDEDENEDEFDYETDSSDTSSRNYIPIDSTKSGKEKETEEVCENADAECENGAGSSENENGAGFEADENDADSNADENAADAETASEADAPSASCKEAPAKEKQEEKPAVTVEEDTGEVDA